MKLHHRKHGLIDHINNSERGGAPLVFLLMITLSLLVACDLSSSLDTSVTLYDQEFEPSDWSSNTHSKSADPDFDEVFDNSVVKRIDIVITDDNWQSMLNDMTSLYGAFGGSTQGGGGPGGGDLDETENPIFVPAEFFYNDLQWYRVGIRFKGNSSLSTSWKSGILKLSLKLDFDEFEDDYPQIDNQRFYGFKKLSLKNNFDDSSFLREKVATEVFQDAGLAASHTAFYQLYVDYGEGSEYFGLYTLVEEVDDTVIETQFSSDDGNLYKPEGDGASFASGMYNEADLVKKTNEDLGDWTDIQYLYEILHDDTRTSNPAMWRANLDSIFDTDVFLKYLAVNTVIQNWDTYGRMTHNYFLYNNPSNGKLTWIPWDNNEALQEGKMSGALALNFSDLQSQSWPIIAYLYADEVYRSIYDGFVQQTRDDWFETSKLQSKYTSYSALVESSAEAELPGYTFLSYSGEFVRAISTLNSHVSSRSSAVDNYLY